MIGLAKFLAMIAVTVMVLAALTSGLPMPEPVPAGAVTAYPIPQRPAYAPNPWVYPKPTVAPANTQ